MIGESKLRKARREYQCSEWSYHTIRPGDIYLRCVMPPWHELACGKKWQVRRSCLRCCKEYGMLDSDQKAQVGIGS